jgi:hypothetical protein
VADKTRAQPVSGLVLVLLGIPVHLLWRRAASGPMDHPGVGPSSPGAD